MLIFKSIEYKNFLSTGNHPNKILLNTANLTLQVGSNGHGKCVKNQTLIKIQNKKTGEIIETTIEELYEQEKKNNKRKD